MEHPMSDDRFLVDWQALKKLGWCYSRTHTWRKIAAGTFPKPIKFGEHPKSRVVWRWKDIKDYLDAISPVRPQ
jgi:predicted DNA-binding transcriptional regulator AlpA